MSRLRLVTDGPGQPAERGWRCRQCGWQSDAAGAEVLCSRCACEERILWRQLLRGSQRTAPKEQEPSGVPPGPGPYAHAGLRSPRESKSSTVFAIAQASGPGPERPCAARCARNRAAGDVA